MNSHRHSPDSDDWTLVSPQPSPSSSPERQSFLLNQSRSTQTSQSGSDSDSSLKDIIDDGLTEIELNDNFIDHNVRISETISINASAYQACEETGGSSSTDSIQGFQPIDTTTDEEFSTNGSRRSSLTLSQLNEYVDIGETSKDSGTITVTSQINNLDTSVVACNGAEFEIHSQQEQQSTSNSPQQQQQESSPNERPRLTQPLDALIFRLLDALFWFLVLVLASIYTVHIADFLNRNGMYLDYIEKTNLTITPSQRVELRLLNQELSQCVQRQSPSSFKYYISEEPIYSSRKDVSGSIKARRGLFCYGQEAKWRSRFDRLKSEYNLDLRTLVDDAKKYSSAGMLRGIDKALDFKLIINQLEYLDFLESRRNKRQSDETIKYLKAENLQLLRRLNQPNETGYQKVVVELELRNSKLQRENEALKAKFVEKAGPVYIKQSMELERLESDNVVLKQFLQQIGKDVSKSLRQFNLHTVDTSTIIDDHKSLNAQIMLTKGYMRRLSEKISTVLIENEGLKEELKEVYLSLSAATNNLPAAHNREMNNNHAVDARDRNDSNALMAENCMRSLYELREKSSRFENENERLKRDCLRNSHIEKSPGRDLNRTNEVDERYGIGEQSMSNSWKRIGSSDTAVDKSLKDMLAMKNDDTFLDELMVFLTKFNNHVESNELAKVKHLVGKNQEGGDLLVGAENFQQHQQHVNKIIPNYIREAIRGEGVNEMQRDIQSDGKLLSGQGDDFKNDDKLKIPAPMMTNPLESPSDTYYQDYDTGSILSGMNVGNYLSESEGSREYEDQLQQRSVAQNHSDESAPPCWQSHKPSNLPLSDNFAANEDNKNPHGASSEKSARDTWFFKRAKQRRQLRHSDLKMNSRSTDWAMKRAKLREKLRKASSYIEYHYLPKGSTFDGDEKYSQNLRYINNRHDHNDKNHNKKQQTYRNYNKYFRDEL